MVVAMEVGYRHSLFVEISEDFRNCHKLFDRTGQWFRSALGRPLTYLLVVLPGPADDDGHHPGAPALRPLHVAEAT